jgi:uncharacterized OsmC-like protein
MTQIGRYAKIKKYTLQDYRIDQLTSFDIQWGQSEIHPITTATHITSDYTDEVAKDILKMSEQTCFLHGAMKKEHPINFEWLIRL